MPISVTCPGCRKRLKAKDGLAGRTVACPACGTKLVIGSAEDVAAALLLGETTPQAAEPEVPPPRPDVAPPKRTEKPPTSTAGARPDRPETPRAVRDVRSLPPLATNDPPLWLRHLHWLLVLSLIPLAVSLLQPRQEEDFAERLLETLAQAPAEARQRAGQAIAELEDGKGSLDKVFAALPDHKLRGAFLPRDTWMHWPFTGGAALLFFTFLLALSIEGSATPRQLLAVGLFTATIGLVLLLCVQALAEWTQGVIVIPRSIVGILFWILKLIGLSYRMALDPENGFFLSFIGFTLGVGLCEEVCKALPLIFKYRHPNEQSWRGAYLWGLASGAGFGLAEGVLYAGDYYNGISGAGIYFVRYISCVALHALWTGSAAITVHRRQHLFQQEMAWYDWLVRTVAVVAVPMVLHGLYDTLLKKDLNAPALAVAVFSFLYLAFQISRLRGVDDRSARADMLREYQRRRNALGVR